MNDVSRLSIVVPAFDEQENVPVLYSEILAVMDGGDALWNPESPENGPEPEAGGGCPWRPREWEVLFVDDASRDATLKRIKDLAGKDGRVKYIAFAENRGQSAAFSAGFRAASGDVLATMDADLQNDPVDLPRLLALYARGADMVVGWRANRKDTFGKRVASKIGNGFRNRLTRTRVRDTGCSLKVMNAAMARRIPMFTGMHRFLPTLMDLMGASIEEVAVNHRPRKFGKSKYGILDRAVAGLYDLMAVRWMEKRFIRYQIRETNIP